MGLLDDLAGAAKGALLGGSENAAQGVLGNVLQNSSLGGLNGLHEKIPRAEGVAIDEHGTIYMVSEPDLFYVFKREAAKTD